MKKLFTEEEYNNAKSTDLLLVECYICGQSFKKQKNAIVRVVEFKKSNCIGRFCSRKCQGIADRKRQLVNCTQCGKQFEKKSSEIKKSPNNFCGHKCSATYQSAHKTTGSRRSKLEIWIEQQLINDYPNLTIKYNDRTQIGSELDVYVEDFKLAFELNGIFHYEPIYGEDKLEKIQNNDNRKFAACLEKGIELCIIDSSSSKNFKPERDVKYLNIIKNIIERKIGR